MRYSPLVGILLIENQVFKLTHDLTSRIGAVWLDEALGRMS
jgi:hypothetical protein